MCAVEKARVQRVQDREETVKDKDTSQTTARTGLRDAIVARTTLLLVRSKWMGGESSWSFSTRSTRIIDRNTAFEQEEAL